MGSDYHRKANIRTQTIRVAVDQNRSRELWGRGAFGGLPAALAYVGALGAGEQGTQFTTTVPHAKNGDPVWAYWYLPEDGGDARVKRRVVGNKDYACVEIQPRLNRYRCK